MFLTTCLDLIERDILVAAGGGIELAEGLDIDALFANEPNFNWSLFIDDFALDPYRSHYLAPLQDACGVHPYIIDADDEGSSGLFDKALEDCQV
jgi:hypothetical protein